MDLLDDTRSSPNLFSGTPSRQKAGSARLAIFNLVMRAPRGVTCDEVVLRTGVPHHTASSALCRMVKQGVLSETGEFRATRTGRPAKVYARRIEEPKKRKR